MAEIFELHEQAIELMRVKRYPEALSIFFKALEKSPSFWVSLNNVGNCYLHMNDLNNALNYFNKALAISPNEPNVWLNIGIVQQQKNDYVEAINSFRQAIEINPDYELAYNSLALTQKMQGKLELALHNYDAGVKALTRRIVKSLRNDRSNKVFKLKNKKYYIWIEYAGYGATYLWAISKEIPSIGFPSEEMAADEERNERHQGLYWSDEYDSQGKMMRLFLPNYFETFFENLKSDDTYANFLGNMSVVLQELGRHEESQKHVDEAHYFVSISYCHTGSIRNRQI